MRRNEAEQPAAIFVGYSVISSIQSTGPVFGPLDALFACRVPMSYCLADEIRGASHSLVLSTIPVASAVQDLFIRVAFHKQRQPAL